MFKKQYPVFPRTLQSSTSGQSNPMCAYKVLKCNEIISMFNGRIVSFYFSWWSLFVLRTFGYLRLFSALFKSLIAHEIIVCPANLRNSFTCSKKTPRILRTMKFHVNKDLFHLQSIRTGSRSYLHGVTSQETITVATSYIIQGSLTLRFTKHTYWISTKNIKG